MMACIEEYERIKRKESVLFKTVKEFCEYHDFSHQNFMKVYHRYKLNPVATSLVPQKRGPRFRTRRTDVRVEERVVEIRAQGLNRYEIRDVLKSEGMVAPCPATIYNILRKHGLNRIDRPQKQERRRIIMSRIGELVHIDCHQLSKGLTIENPGKNLYLVGVIDDYSRLAWVEVMDDKKSLTVMFAVLKAFNILKKQYGVEVDVVMTDNGAEFGSGKDARNKDGHPFERLLAEMQMKHTYTQPYRPQTNGKIERFWKTLNEDFIEEALYENTQDLKNELIAFLVYYNEHRPHSAIGNVPPVKMAKTCN
jgi:transposase InsO family protein